MKSNSRMPVRLPYLVLSLCFAALSHSSVWAHQGQHDVVPSAPSNATGPAASAGLSRSTVHVRLPSVKVQQHNGKLVAFHSALDDARPVLLNFVFTSCTSICLPMAQVFAAAQERLGANAGQVQMISVSIDPSQDSPTRLTDYANRLGAGSQWTFHTGSQDAVDAIQRAFNVYRPDKMGHTPVTFVRARGAQQWVRLDGFASPERLIKEAQVLVPTL
jgi:protein SCO1